MLDQKIIWGSLIGAALIGGTVQALADINHIGWRNMSRQERISTILSPILFPLAVFVGLFWGMLALVARVYLQLSQRARD